MQGYKTAKEPNRATERAQRCKVPRELPNTRRVETTLRLCTSPDCSKSAALGIMGRLGAPISMCKNDSYLVRVTSLADSADSFTWEVCKGDPLLVLQRSTRTFPTRVEALFDSASKAFLLAFGPEQS